MGWTRKTKALKRERGEEEKIRRISTTTSWLKMFPPHLGVKGSEWSKRTSSL